MEAGRLMRKAIFYALVKIETEERHKFKSGQFIYLEYIEYKDRRFSCRNDIIMSYLEVHFQR